MSDTSDSDTGPMVTPPEGISPVCEYHSIKDTVKVCKVECPLTVDLEEIDDDFVNTPPMVTPSETVLPDFPSPKSPNMKITKALQKLQLSDIKAVPRSLLSPTSPSSVFSKSVIGAMDGCILDGVLLSQWDNILGPRIRHLWLTSNPETFTLEMLHSVATQTLCGDICRDPDSPHIDTKLYVVKEKNIVVHTFVFGAMGKADPAVHSLSLILPLTDYSLYLQILKLTSTWMHRLIAKLRVLLEKGPTSAAMQIFTSILEEFIQMLACLHQHGVSQHIPVSKTAFHADFQLDPEFMRKAIQSHLMTGGHSVVIGSSSVPVNLVISTLAMFLSNNDKACSCYVSPGVTPAYYPDLFLQGLIKEEGSSPRGLENLELSEHPVTVINLAAWEVKHTSITKHLMHRQELLQDELLSLWRGQSHNSLYAHRIILHPFNDPESIVTYFLDEISLLDDSGTTKETYVTHFTRMLKQKALALFEYVDTETNSGKNPLKKNLKKVKADQGLSLNGDFMIVLASADKLRPGISSLLLGDIKHDTDYVQSLVDSY